MRAILKFTKLAIGGTLVKPSEMFLLKGDYYVNRKLGLAFKKPKEWEFEALTGFPDFERGQIFQNLEKEQQKEYLEYHLETLVVVISKYSSEELRFSPGITIHRNSEEYQTYSEKIVEMIHDYISASQTTLKDYTCYETPEEIRLLNCKAIRFKSRYVFEHEKTKPTLIDDEFIGIEHRDSFYSIHLCDSPYVGEVAQNEFRMFLSSLHLI